MPISRVQGANNGVLSGTSTTIAATFGAGITAGDLVVGVVSWDNNSNTATLSSVKDNAGTPNTFTISNTVNDTVNSQSSASFFFQYTGTGGPTIITATFSAAVDVRTILVTEYAGISNVADPRDGNTGQLQTATTNPSSGNITTTVSGDLIWGATVNTGDLTQTATAGSGFTVRESNTTAVHSYTEDQVQGSAGAIAATFTGSGSTAWATFEIAFKSGAANTTVALQPPQPLFRSKIVRYGALIGGDQGNELPQIKWLNTGWEVQPPQPPHPHPEWRAAAIMPKDDGIEASEIRWFNTGWEKESHQPQHPRPEKWGTLVGGDQGNEFTEIRWFNTGWEIQPVQPPLPPHRRTAKSGAIQTDEDGDESPLIKWFNVGWEIQSYQPQHQRPERWGLFAKGDEGIEAAFVQPTVTVLVGFESTLSFLRVSLPRQRYPGTKGTSQFPIFPTFVPMGWEVQPPQPNHPRPERAGSVMFGDTGIEATYVFVATTVGWGWEIQSIQPPYRRVRDTPFPWWNVDAQLVNFYPAGWEIQAVQPPHRRPERAGGMMHGDDGNQAAQINFYVDGWEVQPFQPQHQRPERAGVIRSDDGNEFPFINFYPAGWAVQPYQPQHPRPERSGSIMPVEPGIEAAYVFVTTTVGWGWEIQSVQPPIYPTIKQRGIGISGESVFAAFNLTSWTDDLFRDLVRIKRPDPTLFGDAGIEAVLVTTFITSSWGFDPTLPLFQMRPHKQDARGNDGIQSTLVNWYNAGWEIQSYQPQHQKPERAGSIMPVSNIEFVEQFFFPYSWSVQPVQPNHPRFEKFGAISLGRVDIEAQFAAFYPAGWEIPSFEPLRFSRAKFAGFTTVANVEVVFYNWLNAGWEIQPPPPQPMRFSRAAVLIGGDAGAEQTEINWYNAGWEIQSVQPPHLRPEKWGSLAKGDEGIENTYSFVAPVVVNGGYEGVWPQPPHPRYEKFGSHIGGDQGNEFPLINWKNTGWEIAPHQPRHPRPEEFGVLIGGDLGTEFPQVRWFNAGWEVQPPQPPHPRREKFGTLIGSDPGNYASLISFFSFGFENQAWQPPHPNPNMRFGAMAPFSNIEGVFVFVPPPPVTDHHDAPFIGKTVGQMMRL